LEHVARRVGEAVLKEYPAVTDIKVKVSKMNPPLGGQMHSVSVELELKA
jgi:dihydroneopterin aldolase